MKLSALVTDETAEKNGVWRSFDGAEFLIAANMNPAHQRAIQKYSRGVPPAKLRNDPPTVEAVTINAMADAILMDWRGEVLGLDEKPMVPTTENKRMLLSIRQFREWIAGECQQVENYQTEARTADIGDLKSES